MKLAVGEDTGIQIDLRPVAKHFVLLQNLSVKGVDGCEFLVVGASMTIDFVFDSCLVDAHWDHALDIKKILSLVRALVSAKYPRNMSHFALLLLFCFCERRDKNPSSFCFFFFIAPPFLSPAPFVRTYVTVTEVEGKKNVMLRRRWSTSSSLLLLTMVCSKHPPFGSTRYLARSDARAINGCEVWQW